MVHIYLMDMLLVHIFVILTLQFCCLLVFKFEINKV